MRVEYGFLFVLLITLLFFPLTLADASVQRQTILACASVRPTANATVVSSQH